MQVYDHNCPVFYNVATGGGVELEGLEPLFIAPLAVGKVQKTPPKVSPSWVVENVKDFYHIVGLSCDGFEAKLLKRLNCSMNYEKKGRQPCKGGTKGRASLGDL